jgi:hypothetical protein
MAAPKVNPEIDVNRIEQLLGVSDSTLADLSQQPCAGCQQRLDPSALWWTRDGVLCATCYETRYGFNVVRRC